MHHERGYRTPYGDTMWWVAGEDATGGAYSLHERLAPPGSASVPHIHSRLSEAFYVMSGRVTFRIGDRTIEATAGDYAIALPGVQHAWAVAGDEEARVLVTFAPSVRRAYFEEMDAIVGRGRGAADRDALSALGVKYGWD
jgi:mannose-6-phosphate isomerase-like protein (cupin superfamily)